MINTQSVNTTNINELVEDEDREARPLTFGLRARDSIVVAIFDFVVLLNDGKSGLSLADFLLNVLDDDLLRCLSLRVSCLLLLPVGSTWRVSRFFCRVTELSALLALPTIFDEATTALPSLLLLLRLSLLLLATKELALRNDIVLAASFFLVIPVVVVVVVGTIVDGLLSDGVEAAATRLKKLSGLSHRFH